MYLEAVLKLSLNIFKRILCIFKVYSMIMKDACTHIGNYGRTYHSLSHNYPFFSLMARLAIIYSISKNPENSTIINYSPHVAQ
jgi:hypothetical protein